MRATATTTEVRDAQGRPSVTIAEAARRKGVTKEAIRQAIKRGALAETTFGHLKLVTVASLDRYRPDPKHVASGLLNR